MKKLIILVLVLGFAPHVLAAGFTALAPIPGLTGPDTTSVASSGSLTSFFNNLYKYLIGLAATLAVIQIIRAGIEVAMNRDNVSKMLDSKGKIYNAIYGLILVLSPVLVFSIINPSILNLSLGLSPLQTSTSTNTTSFLLNVGNFASSSATTVVGGGKFCYPQRTGAAPVPTMVCSSDAATCASQAAKDPTALGACSQQN